jgi:hypothetical protein
MHARTHARHVPPQPEATPIVSNDENEEISTSVMTAASATRAHGDELSPIMEASQEDSVASTAGAFTLHHPCVCVCGSGRWVHTFL